MTKSKAELITDLYWEYDRMSSSGQETLDQLAKLFGIPNNEELNEIMEESND